MTDASREKRSTETCLGEAKKVTAILNIRQGHNLFLFDGLDESFNIIACCMCGAFMATLARGLNKQCPRKPPSEGCKVALRRLQSGLHPKIPLLKVSVGVAIPDA